MHIYDCEFITGKVPITKQEVRAISIAKLQLKESSTLIDVGAGTGSISIEAATYLKSGKVYSIEKNQEGHKLIESNIKKFSCNNVELLKGNALDVLPNIEYDRMFIGGNGGELKEILEHFIKYSSEDSKLVINVIALESLATAKSLLEELKFKNIEICNISVSRGEKKGGYTFMMGNNPIYIITAEKGEL